MDAAAVITVVPHAVGTGTLLLVVAVLAVGGLLGVTWLADTRAPSRRPAARSAVPAGAGGVEPDATQARAVGVRAGERSPKVLVTNHSDAPVHDVRAFVALGRRRPEMVGWLRTLPPTGDEPARIALTAEGRESWIRWQRDSRGGRQGVGVECTFRDDTDQFWRLDRTGDVHAIDADEALGEPRRR